MLAAMQAVKIYLKQVKVGHLLEQIRVPRDKNKILNKQSVMMMICIYSRTQLDFVYSRLQMIFAYH